VHDGAAALLSMAAELEAVVSPLEQRGATGGQRKVRCMQYVCLCALVAVCQADTGRQGSHLVPTRPFLLLLQLPFVPVEAGGGEGAAGGQVSTLPLPSTYNFACLCALVAVCHSRRG
jgi:hypothetical protein